MQAEIDDSAQVVEDLLQAAGGGEGFRSPEPPPSLKRNASGRIADFMRRSFRFKRTVSSPHRSPSSPGFDKKSPIIEEVDLMPPSFFRRQDSVIFKVRPGQRFTQYADVVVDQPHKAPADLGNLGELKHLIQTGRRKQVKKYIRSNNWPAGHRVRAELWKELCKDSERGGRISLYREKIDQLVASGVKTLKPSFLSSDGVVVCNHSLKEEGAVSLQRLLTVVECIRPEITHVPILYPMAALFLHYMSEEDAFACIMRLLLASGQKFFLQTETAAIASKITLLTLVKKYRSAAYQFLRHQTLVNDDERLSQVLADWMGWIFRDLPFQHLIRVIDCFLYEGQKVLYRVTLALLDLWVRSRKQNPPLPADEDSTMQRLAATAHDISDFVRNLNVPPDTLLKTAFSIRNLKGGHIKRLQDRNELAVRQSGAEMSVTAVQRQEQNMKARHHLSDVSFRSSVLTQDTVADVIAALPTRLQLEMPRLLYRLSTDGASFSSFWAKIDAADQTIIIIRSVTGEVFGAYCSSSWSERRDKYERAKTRFFGTGESFVWSVEPEGSMVIYRWSGSTHEQPETCPQMFQAAGDTWFVIGGGGGEAIAIYDELTSGITSECQTFGSPPLVRGGGFVIDDLEVYAVPSGCDD